MQRFITRLAMAGLGLAGGFAVSQAAGFSIPTKAIGDAIAGSLQKGERTAITKEQATALLQRNSAEVTGLQGKASNITKSIGEIAATGNLPTSDEAIALLKTLVSELQDTNQRLKKLEEDMENVKSWISDQSSESIPNIQNDVATLKRARISNYVQFQWVDTQEDVGRTTNDGFQVRRFRIGQTNKLDAKTSMKLSFDVAASSQRVGAELKDAQLIYDIVPGTDVYGIKLIAGQQVLPLGYELGRSSTDREFPERAAYNSAAFAGDRDRGLRFDYGLGKAGYVHVGVWNGLTTSDVQQTAANTFRNLDSKYGVTGGIRLGGANYEIGVSGFIGKRPAGSNGTAPDNAYPEVERKFAYVDASYILGKLTFRGELMYGKDRLPVLLSNGKPRYLAATDMYGWQAQLTFGADARNQFHVRYQQFDPDTGDSATSSGSRSAGLGFGYTYWMNSYSKFTITYEQFWEQISPFNNNVFTARYQFKL